MGGADRRYQQVELLAAMAEAGSKPHYVLNTRRGLMDRGQIDTLRRSGAVVISGIRQGLSAIGQVSHLAKPPPTRRELRSTARPRLSEICPGAAQRSTIHEHDAKRALNIYGVPIVSERLVDSLDEAKVAARSLGYPVALKVVSDELPHKSEHGLVAIELSHEVALAEAWGALRRNLDRLAQPPKAPPSFLVQAMAPRGIEVFAGVIRDPDFGLFIAFGLGGLAIEVVRDFSLRPLPLCAGEAEAMISETSVASLLQGARARVPYDLGRLAKCLYTLSDFAVAEAELVAEIDLNPIIVSESGCVVVDALIVPRR
jgi:hypothetical protein